MNRNQSWNLQSFLDSLIFELDKARDTLAIKGVNKPLTYAVKDLNLDLQLFPEFDGNQVKFTTAKPGESGASRISISLGSITDRQIRETTRVSASKDDLVIDDVEELEPEVKDELKKIGVQSVSDLENLEARDIDIAKVAPTATNSTIGDLAEKLKSLRNKKNYQRKMSQSQSLRMQTPPKVRSVRMRREGNDALVTLTGEHLGTRPDFRAFATLNDQPAVVESATENEAVVRIPGQAFRAGENDFRLALDPFAIIRLNLQ